MIMKGRGSFRTVLSCRGLRTSSVVWDLLWGRAGMGQRGSSGGLLLSRPWLWSSITTSRSGGDSCSSTPGLHFCPLIKSQVMANEHRFKASSLLAVLICLGSTYEHCHWEPCHGRGHFQMGFWWHQWGILFGWLGTLRQSQIIVLLHLQSLHRDPW